MQHRGPWRPSNEQRAPGWAVLGVVLGVLLAGLVAIPGCLNPRPEEDPSALELAEPVDESVGADHGDPPGATDPVRETCDDNPLLAGCEPASELPSESPGANPAPPVNGEPSPAVPADAGAPDVSDAGGVDAGATTAAGSPLAE